MSTAQQELNFFIDDTFNIFDRTRQTLVPRLLDREIGVVEYVGRGIARLTGLSNAQQDELLQFSGGLLGMVFNLVP